MNASAASFVKWLFTISQRLFQPVTVWSSTLGEIVPLIVFVQIHKAAFPISHQCLVNFSALLVVQVVPIILRAEPRLVFQADDSTFRVVDLEAVIDSFGLHGENRGCSMVPFNAGAVAVIAKAFDEISPGG